MSRLEATVLSLYTRNIKFGIFNALTWFVLSNAVLTMTPARGAIALSHEHGREEGLATQLEFKRFLEKTLFCVLHFSNMLSVTPYPFRDRPVILSQQSNVSSIWMRHRYSLYKARNHNCSITMILPPAVAIAQGTAYWKPWLATLVIMKTEDTPVYTRMKPVTRFATELLVFVAIIETDPPATIERIQSRYVGSPQQLLIFLVLRTSQNQMKIDYGLYHCVYCANANAHSWYQFHSPLCFREIKNALLDASGRGRYVTWKLGNFLAKFGSRSRAISQKPYKCDCARSSCWNIEGTSLHFITEGLNMSKIAQKEAYFLSTSGHYLNELPRLLSIPQKPFDHGYSFGYGFFPMGVTGGLKFITSDGVYEPVGSAINTLDDVGVFNDTISPRCSCGRREESKRP